MSELSAALRRFADSIDAGQVLPSANQCAVVLADAGGAVQATYIGTLLPANRAGIHLLAAGIQRFNADQLAGGAHSATRGSTH